MWRRHQRIKPVHFIINTFLFLSTSKMYFIQRRVKSMGFSSVENGVDGLGLLTCNILSPQELGIASLCFSQTVDSKLFQLESKGQTTDYGCSMKPFSSKSLTFGLRQTNWAYKFWGICGIFGRFISTHFGTVSVLPMFSIN